MRLYIIDGNSFKRKKNWEKYVEMKPYVKNNIVYCIMLHYDLKFDKLTSFLFSLEMGALTNNIRSKRMIKHGYFALSEILSSIRR